MTGHPDWSDLEALQQQLGYRFADLTLLQRALAHRSWVAEIGAESSNERLEFLGDAVLGWVVADIVFRRYTSGGEGTLTDLRKSVVNGQTLAEVARSIGLGQFMRLGKGEANGGGSDKVSILSDGLEAVIGAIYLDGGRSAAFDFIEERFLDRIQGAVGRLNRLDEKSALQELALRLDLEPPTYAITSSGPDHDKQFVATVEVGDIVGRGEGRSKKSAEQVAASEVVSALLNIEADNRRSLSDDSG